MDIGRFLVDFPRKIGSQGRLVLRDPKRAVEYVDDLIRPEKMRQRLLGLEPVRAMNVRIDPGATGTPHLNVLLPKLAGRLTGGTNTAINIAVGMAQAGIPVRLLATDGGPPSDPDALWRHIASLTGLGQARPNIVFASTADPANPAALGARDVFLATYWTTASSLKSILPRMAVKEFIYLIQDFEPGFYAWSSRYAQALETYGMRFRALINEQLLADHLVQTRSGRFAEPGFLSRCSVFEPAVDRALFHPDKKTGSTRKLLFYARPYSFRNLYGIGFEALRAATSDPVFADGDWTFLAIGSGTSLGRIPLGGGHFLDWAPWASYEDYARMIRESDILLSLMLSPHTSYPVIEMPASGGLVVTNTFGSKTEERLRAISTNIISAPPSAEAISAGLISAAGRLASGSPQQSDVPFASDWGTALRDTVASAIEMFREAVQSAETNARSSA